MNNYWLWLNQIIIISGVGLSLSQATPAQTGETAVEKSQTTGSDSTEFLRMTTDENGVPNALQTAIVRYRSNDQRVLVDLIAAVHIGDAQYYRQLNRQFDEYEVVLYELVAPEGTRIPAGGADTTSNPISWLQHSTQSLLGLQSQMEEVDYQKKHFVHADMSPADISGKMQQRGHTPLTVGLSAVAEIWREQNKAAQKLAGNRPANADGTTETTEENLLELLADPLKLKVLMARQFTQSGAMELGLGRTLSQMLITDRNQAAIRVLQQQLAGGKTKIAIFYGAAHMPDFQRRLGRDFDLHRTKQVWVDAWDLKRPLASSVNNPAALLLRMLQELE